MQRRLIYILLLCLLFGKVYSLVPATGTVLQLPAFHATDLTPLSIDTIDCHNGTFSLSLIDEDSEDEDPAQDRKKWQYSTVYFDKVFNLAGQQVNGLPNTYFSLASLSITGQKRYLLLSVFRI